jgi:hypothetical protein
LIFSDVLEERAFFLSGRWLPPAVHPVERFCGPDKPVDMVDKDMRD